MANGANRNHRMDPTVLNNLTNSHHTMGRGGAHLPTGHHSNPAEAMKMYTNKELMMMRSVYR